MTSLSDVTRRYQLEADARAFFLTSIGKALQWSPEMLQGRLDREHLAVLAKTAVSPLTSTTVGGGAEFVPLASWAASYRGLVDVATTLFNIGATITPLNITVPSEVSSGNFDFVAENSPVPATGMVLASATLLPKKIAGIRTVSWESLQHGVPSVLAMIQRDSIRQLALALDFRSWDPGSTATSARPASLTSAATEITLAGTTAADIEAGMRDGLSAISGGTATNPAIVVNGRAAHFLSALRSSTGQSAFKQMAERRGPQDGFILGTKVLIGQGVPDIVAFVDGDGVVIGDGGVEIDASRSAALAMDDAPSSPSTLVSLPQAGNIGILVERRVSWVRRSDAVSFFRLGLGGSPEWP